MSEKIRLMLADDHDVVRQGLITLFEGYPDITIVAEARNGQEAIENALESQPDVILMDITMPVMDGFEATRQLAEKCPNCRVLALTVHEDRQFMLEMIDSGACGFVTKRSLADDVVVAIRIIAKGGMFLSPHFTKILAEDFRKMTHGQLGEISNIKSLEADKHALSLLSEREKEVIALVADGQRSTEVGKILGITARTVSRHRARIAEKLGMDTTVHLVKFAIRNGLTEL